MAMVSVVLVAVYRWIWGSGRLVWSKDRQPPGARAALAKWTGWTIAVAVHCYNDSTINIVAAITITITVNKKATFQLSWINDLRCVKFYWSESQTSIGPGKDMDMRTASRTGRSGLRDGLQYSEHIRFKLVTTTHNSQPNVSSTWTTAMHQTTLQQLDHLLLQWQTEQQLQNSNYDT